MTIYYLLLKKNLRLGINSPADICSNNFDENRVVFKVPDEEVGARNITTVSGSRGGKRLSLADVLVKNNTIDVKGIEAIE